MRALEADRLILNSISSDEYEAVYKILVDEIEGELFTREAFETEILFDRYLAQQPLGQHFGRPAIYLKSGRRYIGYCLLMPRLCSPEEREQTQDSIPRNSLEAEIGWTISSRHRNCGYATEAATALIEYAFRELHLPRIVAFTENDNAASLKVMQKLGLRTAHHSGATSVKGILENEEK